MTRPWRKPEGLELPLPIRPASKSEANNEKLDSYQHQTPKRSY